MPFYLDVMHIVMMLQKKTSNLCHVGHLANVQLYSNQGSKLTFLVTRKLLRVVLI